MNAENLARLPLVNSLREAITTHRLTLVSAPAGAGKTTLLASLSAAFPDLAVAWLSLDPEDNDPSTFLTGFLAALHRLDPELMRQSQAFLANVGPSGDALRQMMGVLINEVLAADPEPLILVLDDFHLIDEPAILTALDYLLERLPPALHLAITTRYDPSLALARLRARGHLAEFRLADLHFTPAEVSSLLNDHFQLDLSEDEVQTLQARTEGWVAGLRLLAVSLSGIDTASERSAFIRGLTRANRHVFDLLAEEVLRHQPPALRTFLLETAILPELTPDLVTTVTGRPDAPDLLETAYRRNLFLTTVNETGSAGGATYRYHDLFAAFLRHQLEREAPERLIELHRRAAAHSAPARAIQHYLAAEIWAEAADLIEELGRRQMRQSFVRQQLVDWIERLPDAVNADRPWLKLLRGAYAVQTGQRQTAAPLLFEALSAFETNGPKEGEMLALYYLSQIEGVDRRADLIRRADEMMRTHPQLASPLKRTTFRLGMAWRGLYLNDWAEVEKNLSEALEITRQSGDVGAYQFTAQSIGPQFLFSDQGMPPIERYCRHVLARFGEGEGLIQAGTYAVLGCITFFQGKLAEARQAAGRSQRIGEALGGFAYLHMLIDHVRLFDLLASADYDALAHYLEAVWPRLEQVDTYRAMQTGYYYVWGRALLMQGRLDEARQIYPRTEPAFQYYAGEEAHDRASLLGGYIALHEQRYPAAEEQLRRAAGWQRRTRHTILSGDARLGLARVYLEWNRPEQALAELRPALAGWDQRDMPGVLLQEGRGIIPLLEFAVAEEVCATFARRVLHLFGAEPPVAPPATPPVKLSNREREVLQLLAAGLTNREIAAKLVIAPSTVKRHTINIYNKLDVNNRTQAVTRAHAWDLL